MKKILVVTQHFPPESVGRATRIHGLAKFLSKSHKVRVLAPPPTWPFTKHKKAGYLYKGENFDGLDILRLWTRQPSKLVPSFFENVGYLIGFPILASFFLLTHVSQVSTVIVSTPPTSLLLVTLMARFLRKRIIIDVGDLEYNPELFVDSVRKHSFLKKLMRRFEKKSWEKSDVVLTNNLVIQEIIKKRLDQKFQSKVDYFPINLDLDVFKKQSKVSKNQIVYVGMLGPLQNLEPLIKSMNAIKSEIPDIKLEIYGGGTEENRLKKLVSDLKLESQCIINGPVLRDKVPQLLSESKVGIVSLAMDKSLSFATPTKTFEYMACSLPVFAYGASEELERIIKKSGAGVYVKSNDHSTISQELIKMINDNESLQNFSKNGRDFVEKSTADQSFLKFV